jgi:hypothetical protein
MSVRSGGWRVLETAPSWTADGEATGARFGGAVAGAGDVNGDGFADVVVGADNQETPLGLSVGRAYLYLGSASGFAPIADWTADGESEADNFAESVAIAGDVDGDGYDDVLVGTGGAGLDSASRFGAAYLYLGSSTGLESTATWSAVGGANNDFFGGEVASAGDVNGDGYADLLVGAAQTGDAVGTAYLYLGSPSGPGPTPDWTLDGPAPNSVFGEAVSAAGDVDGDGFDDVLIGARLEDTAGANSGRIYLFTGSSSGLGSTPLWTADGESVSDQFGISVASAGDTNSDGFDDLVVGAHYATTSVGDSGRAYLYLGSPTGPSTSPAWTFDGEQDADGLGQPVAGAGDVDGDGYDDVIVGYEGAFAEAGLHAGRAHLFRGTPTGLVESPASTDEGEAAFDLFGSAVTSAGDVDDDGFDDVLIGANGADGGRIYLFAGATAALLPSADWTMEGDVAGGQVGESVASAGDVDGDGYDDVIIGAPTADTPSGAEAGLARVFLGSPSGLESLPAWEADGGAGDWFGVRVAAAGDVDGDDFDDVLVSARSGPSPGNVSLFLGSASGPSLVADWNEEANPVHSQMGAWCLSSAGDVDGDGFDEVLIGSGASPYPYGSAEAYFGSPTGPSLSPDWSFSGSGDTRNLGVDCDAMDSDGDGLSDVVVGASHSNHNGAGSGRILVFLGSAGGLSTSPTWYVDGEAGGHEFGYSVSSADVNDDGSGDVLAAAWYADFGGVGSGRAYVFLGSSSGLDSLPAWTFDGEPEDNLGTPGLASAGDIDGDGYEDVAVGATLYDGIQGDDAGRAYLFRGSASGLLLDPSWRSDGTESGDWFGFMLDGAGDVDGDGYGDVIVGAPHADTLAGVESGEALLFYGYGDTDGDGDPDWSDCDDGDPAVFAGAPEVCDGIDDDCDTLVDEDFDLDLDGWTTCGGDCDDDDAWVHPGATENCDLVDSDCDGSLVDEFDDTDADLDPNCTDPDDDDDGDPDVTDCSPLEASVYTGASESCDPVDSDCDGSLVDEFDDTDGDLDPDCTDPDDDDDGDPDISDCAPLDDSIHAMAREMNR